MLGNLISTTKKDSRVADGITQFWTGYNMFMSDFGYIKTDVKCKLFQQYSCCYYGAPQWDLQNTCWQYVHRMAEGTQKVLGANTSYT